MPTTKQGASRQAVEQAIAVVMDLRRRFREQDRPDKVRVRRGELARLVEGMPPERAAEWEEEVRGRAKKGR